jgi:hypothetical protein
LKKTGKIINARWKMPAAKADRRRLLQNTFLKAASAAQLE